MLVRRGMGVISDAPPCPTGFYPATFTNSTTGQPDSICRNAAGWTPSTLASSQAQQTASNADNEVGLALLAAAALALFMAPGAAKMIALPLAYVGVQKALAGFSI